ncbi:MAG: chloride channel protein, partial [Sphingomonadaceae bacterium]
SGAVWRRRIAIGGGAIVIGLLALLYARIADGAGEMFLAVVHAYWWAPVVLTPVGFALIAAVTRAVAVEAAGSGIPQVIAASRDPINATNRLVSLKTSAVKFVLMPLGLMVGASAGREGPTVQIGAAIMAYAHRLAKLPMRSPVLIAGGAAGVSAAFNTPLAGVAFAIEELAAAYEQRMTLLVMAAVLIAGMVSLGIAGDYVYFGAVSAHLTVWPAIQISVVAGIAGGLSGGLFAKAMLAVTRSTHRYIATARSRPILFAAACGAIVAGVGMASGLTWGTGYSVAREMTEGTGAPFWYAPAKFVASLATAVAGVPGGIFAPSLSTGAGVGNLLRPFFPDQPAGAIVLLGMVAYFTGVVRAPLTAVIVVVETTASRGLLLPLLAAALVADVSGRMVCRERLYHGLARAFEKPRGDTRGRNSSA